MAHRWMALLVLVGLALFPRPSLAEARVTRCTATAVTVRDGRSEDRQAVCHAAREALAFLATLRLVPRSRLDVELVEVMPEALQGFVGCYRRAPPGIILLSSHACEGKEFWPAAYRGLDKAGIYRSFVAHEIAHAVAAEQFLIDDPAPAAVEYIAAVVQIGAMASDLRAEVLARVEGDGFDAAAEIDLFVYLLDPARFAAESYRHFARLEDGAGFIAELLAGEVRLSDD